MQFPNILLALAAIASTVSASCYTSGENWSGVGNIEAARGAVVDLCNNGQLAGSFTQAQSKNQCAPLPTGNKRADFQVVWRGAGSRPLAASDCILRFTNEINGCSQGGETTTADWYFRSDPNSGRC